MPTLKQILFEKTWIASRERNEIVESVKEWLQQNQEERPCDSRMFGDSKYDAYWDGYERAYRELLEEISQ